MMAILLTSRPARTLRLAWPEPRYIFLAVALVVALNPLVNELRPVVEWLIPDLVDDQGLALQGDAQAPNLAVMIGVFALVPAICEEFAFRGFILSGLEHQHRTRSAILLSALMFGFLHVLALSLFQQLFNATLLGIVLGLLAVRSRSILPGLIFHFLNNAIAVSQGFLAKAPWAESIIPWIYRNPDDGLYHVAWTAASALLSAILLFYLWRLKFDRAGKPDATGAQPVELGFLVRVPCFPNWSWLETARLRCFGPFYTRRDAPLRRGTLTLQARYVLPVEGPPIEDGVVDDRARANRLGGSCHRAPGRSGSGKRRDRPRLCECPHAPRARAARERRPSGHDESEIPWLQRVIDQRRRGDRAIAERDRRSERQGLDRRRHDLPCRHDHGRAELGADRRSALACLGVRRADRAQARPRARDLRIGLEMAGLGPPGNASCRLRTAGLEPPRALQHFGLALLQGSRQPDAALDSPGGNARRAALAQTPRRAAPELPRRARCLGR